MNPSNPTMNDLHHIERVFLGRMQALTLGRPNLASFDYQCSDRWV